MCIVIIAFLPIGMQIRNNLLLDNYVIREVTYFIRKEYETMLKNYL